MILGRQKSGVTMAAMGSSLRSYGTLHKQYPTDPGQCHSIGAGRDERIEAGLKQ
jgi:hypothetical protein